VNFDNAIVYDIEVLPNVFTFDMEFLHSDQRSTWEISQYRDDRHEFRQFLNWCNQNQIPMIGFNNENYDYRVIHQFFMRPDITYQEMREINDTIIKGRDPFAYSVWANKRFAPQVDLYKIHHFDNGAKTTSLKALQINMRSDNVIESALGFDHVYTEDEVNNDLIPYNQWDVKTTKDFAHISMEEIEFRTGLVEQFGAEVLSWNSTKIGEKMLEQQLGDEACYDRSSGRRVKRQTFRHSIKIADIIFPYITFKTPEFQSILDYLNSQTLTADEMTGNLKTKGVFTDLKTNFGGIEFSFGLGGIHGSVKKKRIEATPDFPIRDIDVKSLYPSIAIVNKLYPEHLGQLFVEKYPNLLVERAKHDKGTIQNALYKLAANGAYGKSNSKFSVFFDPQYTMTITINGQLMLAMLAEWLVLEVPTLQLIQINTDGITYTIHKDFEPLAAEICQHWCGYTALILEDADYTHMWIRDVNNYVARDTKGKLKQKGDYWHPDPFNYAESISKSSPPAWHKDFNPTIVTRAAVNAMVYGIDPKIFIRSCDDPYEFVCRVKTRGSDKLMLGDEEIQRTTRYYISTLGRRMYKLAPPPAGYEIGQYKRASKLTDKFYHDVMLEIGPNVWDERIHTKNKSKYANRESNVQAGWFVSECNDISRFDFATVNYDWYVQEAQKLIIL